MSLAALARQMYEAGTPMEGILLALEAVEARDNAATAKRAQAAARKQAQRDRERDSHATVTGHVADISEASPSLDKETSPKPPKEIKPIPRVGSALTRKAAGFGPPDGVEVARWNEFCAQRKKPLSSTAYARINTTLTEAADVGWPPGELVSRSIESGWETIYIPKEPRNGNRTGYPRSIGSSRSSEIDDAARNLGFG